MTMQPSVETVAHAIYDCTDLNRAVLEDAREIAEAVLALIGGHTERVVLAQGWDEGFKSAREAFGLTRTAPHDPRVTNPYRQGASHG